MIAMQVATAKITIKYLGTEPGGPKYDKVCKDYTEVVVSLLHHHVQSAASLNFC